ncbi:MAG: winged helix-turn-helix domain-containing protein [Acidobacteria bacterium]|nr:winged helix-turn-helix domain-containing protein [Acidobacteriota bacterium]
MTEPAKGYKFRHFYLRLGDRRLLNSHGESLVLSEAEFLTLQKLIRNQGRLVVRGDLRVNWDERLKRKDTDADLTKRISLLRAKLFDDKHKPNYILSVRTEGYQFIAPVEVVGENDPEPFSAAEPMETPPAGDGESVTGEPSDAVEEPAVPAAEPIAPAVEAAGEENAARENTTEREAGDAAADPPPDPRDETMAFGNWVRGGGKWITALLGAVVFGSVLLAAYYWPGPAGEFRFHPCEQNPPAIRAGWEWVWEKGRLTTIVGSGGHLALISLALLYYFLNRGPQKFRPIHLDKKPDGTLKDNIVRSTGFDDFDTWNQARTIAEAVLHKYRGYWNALLVFWILLYTVILLPALPDLNFDLNCFLVQNRETVMATIHNLNTLFLILCYYLLNESITNEDENGFNLDNKENVFLRLLIGMGVIALMHFGEAFLSLKFRGIEDYIHEAFRVTSGVFSGLAMALFIAQFLSKFLKSPGWLISILFFYTSLQSLFVFFSEKSERGVILQSLVIGFALILKCLLILYMLWLFSSGRLLFYLVRRRRTHQQVDGEWWSFREVLEK